MKEKLSDEDTKIDHPYNTYLYEGFRRDPYAVLVLPP